jgi:hypothetical protein
MYFQATICINWDMLCEYLKNKSFYNKQEIFKVFNDNDFLFNAYLTLKNVSVHYQ